MTKSETLIEIDKALDEVRPHLKVDGGNVELIDMSDDMVVSIKWLGSCVTCAMSDMTLKMGVEQAVKSRVPDVKAVEPVNGYNTNSEA